VISIGSDAEVLVLAEKIDTIERELYSLVEIPSTCEEYAKKGATKNGRFKIQPSLTVPPFSVLCEFSGQEAKTIVEKYNEKSTQKTSTVDQPGCLEAGCFTDTVSYNATMSQIKVNSTYL